MKAIKARELSDKNYVKEIYNSIKNEAKDGGLSINFSVNRLNEGMINRLKKDGYKVVIQSVAHSLYDGSNICYKVSW